MNLKLESVP